MEILRITTFKSATEDPQVNQTVELEYKLKNVSESRISGQNVQVIVKNPDGNIIMQAPKEDVPELDPGEETQIYTHSFVPTQNGTYQATLEVDDGAVAETIDITVGGGVGPGENLEPYWGGDGKDSMSGIKPVPVDGSEIPYLELKNSEGASVVSAVQSVTMKIFDLSGRKLLTLESVDNLQAINNLQNGLYLYTITVETDDTYQSPVMKFVVKK